MWNDFHKPFQIVHFLAFCTYPNQIENKDKFSKITITISEKLQPILFATINDFFTSKEGEKYLITMQENNSVGHAKRF
jgi:hypothetical protein